MITSLNDIDPELRELIGSLTRTYENSAEADRALWTQLTELGLSDLTGAEHRNGSGASWWEVAELMGALARVGCTLPVGESDLVAGWLVDEMSIGSGSKLRCVWWDDDKSSAPDLHPLVERVIAIRAESATFRAAEVEPSSVTARIENGGWDTGIEWTPVDSSTVLLANYKLSLLRAMQIVGAMEAATELAVDHARSREQFGRPLSKFQAVQILLADMAAETALARAVVDAAVVAMVADRTEDELVFPIAVARSCVGHGAALVARSAHQVIGAIGTTMEHRLHRHTASMLAWRSEAGDTLTSDKQVLAFVLAASAASELRLLGTTGS